MALCLVSETLTEEGLRAEAAADVLAPKWPPRDLEAEFGLATTMLSKQRPCFIAPLKKIN